MTRCEAGLWPVFSIAIPVAFGIFIWAGFRLRSGTEFFAGYVVKKSRSADNLFAFLLFGLFGLILLATSVQILRDAARGHEKEMEMEMDSENLRSARFIHGFFPVTAADQGTQLTMLDGGKRALPPLTVVTIAAPFTDLVSSA